MITMKSLQTLTSFFHCRFSHRRFFHRFLLLCAVVAAGSLSGGCDPFEADAYREYMVVESYLQAGRNLPVVRLSTTLPIDQAYNFSDAALTGALVRIHLMDDAGEPAQSFDYRMTHPGIYVPESGLFHQVLPGRTYRLEAQLPDEKRLEAETAVPTEFQLTSDR